MPSTTDWSKAIKPLLKKYKDVKHPLEYGNLYQLMVMVILAAQDSDKHINKIAPDFFATYPNLASIDKATPAKFKKALTGVRNGANKATWLLGIAKELKNDKNIPLSLDQLVELPGIGRKSANVIKREMGAAPEGVMVDLHTVRVAPRLGIATGSDPKKIEQQIMTALPKKEWDAGMAMSFLGREICRPTPKCEECLMRPVCKYYREIVKG